MVQQAGPSNESHSYRWESRLQARGKSPSRRPRVLIVNGYFPEVRQPIRLPNEIPNCLAPVLLAGVFAPERCEVRIWNEVSQGFVEVFGPDLLAWPDLLVLTGLTAAFDRMLHLTAYVRTRNPRVVVVAGGYAVRALRRYARRFFDYACVGDAEELASVVAEVLGPEHVASCPVPRYDLAPWIGRRIAYVESSRNCNFRCSFCSLTADAKSYEKRSVEALRQQVAALGKRDLLFFQDNQFHAGDRQFFLDRMEFLQQVRAAGQARYWSAFVTDSFFWREENLRLARESGCFSLFVGVESFDEVWLRRVNKSQNARHSQTDIIRRCLEAGILFQYGLVFDPTERALSDMHREIETILHNPEIPLPNFIFMAIPLPGTPFFHDRVAQGLLLPNTKVRDLEGSTLSMQPLDGVEAVAHFLATAKNMRGYRRLSLAHQRRFLWRYRDVLSPEQVLASTVTALSILAPSTVSNPGNLLGSLLRSGGARTHVSTTDRLDCVYRPRLAVDPRFRGHFEPTWITDREGHLNEELVDDLLDCRFEARQVAQ